MEETKKSEEKQETEKKPLNVRILDEVETSIKTVLDGGITTDNVKTLSELVDIHKDIIEERKEINNMYGNYGNYGNYNRGGSYGREHYGDDYGRRGYDRKYRGDEYMGRMNEEYGRYMESRSRYGATGETTKSLKYMLESMEDFARMLKEDAQSQEEVQMIRETAQRIAQM